MGTAFGCCLRLRKFFTDRKEEREPDKVQLPVLPRPSSTVGDESETSLLKIIKVDALIKENGEAHNTSRYEMMNRYDSDVRLVVRRGQEFALKIHLNRDYDPASDGISFVFILDGVKHPQHGLETFVALPLLCVRKYSGKTWSVCLDTVDDHAINVKVFPPAEALIGKWKIEIDTRRTNSNEAITFNVDQPIYVIFNPWCREDTVFLNNERARHEYVMAETGLIWRGTYNDMSPSVWNFSQFEKDILDCALYLIVEIGKVRGLSRKDPVIISRVLSALNNNLDDNGVVTGSWDRTYPDGVNPTHWLGSKKILQQYYKTKKPVKYGQCWVFAGVLGTICRTLGLPCRVVTNFTSAHDTEGSLTIDYFIDRDGKFLNEFSQESLWNFHVWNEVWMKRPDLGPEYGGWQAIDSTPQERSAGIFRCGPASVTAIKRGEVLRPYDSPFLFAEVNADQVYWRYDGPSKPLKLISKDTTSTGRNISTKAIGSWTREDITHNYKHPERSKEERGTMLRALRDNPNAYSRYYVNEAFRDIEFNLRFLEDILIGQPFSVKLLMKNMNSEAGFQVSIILRVNVVMYTGRTAGSVKKIITEKMIEPAGTEEVRLDLTWAEYGPKLVDQCSFSIICLAKVKDTDFEYFAEDDFRVKKPKIQIEKLTEPAVGQILKAHAHFTNPLPISLRKGMFRVEGPGLDSQMKIKLAENVSPGEKAICEFSLTPKFDGKATIIVKFTSTQLSDVEGYDEFIVKSST